MRRVSDLYRTKDNEVFDSITQKRYRLEEIPESSGLNLGIVLGFMMAILLFVTLSPEQSSSSPTSTESSFQM